MAATTKSQQNLDRVRENQRRCRQRKRDYIADMEARIRNFESQGVEASREVQVAARRVIDENRKLRTLLHRHGVSDILIDTYLQSGAVLSPQDPRSFSCAVPSTGQAVQVVDDLLMAKRLPTFDTGSPPPDTTASASPTTGWDAAVSYGGRQAPQVSVAYGYQAVGGVGDDQGPSPTDVQYGMAMNPYQAAVSSGVDSFSPTSPTSRIAPGGYASAAQMTSEMMSPMPTEKHRCRNY